jgi:tagaturonate reductase
VLPVILAYHKSHQKLPPHVLIAFAALILFYRGDAGNNIQARDAPDILDLFTNLWSLYDGTRQGASDLAVAVLGREELWGRNLNQIQGFAVSLGAFLYEIEQFGITHPLEHI